MIVLDVNILVAAHRDDHPHHRPVRQWFDELLEGEERFCVPPPVAAGFVRVSTHRRVFVVPTPRDDSFEFLRAVQDRPNHVLMHPGRAHLQLFEEMCREGDAVGDLVPDAFLAALAVEHGAGLVSLDRDFARFPRLRWIRPIG